MKAIREQEQVSFQGQVQLALRQYLDAKKEGRHGVR